MDSIALLGGTIVDGTGGPAYRGDLLVREGRIEAITRFEEPPDARIYDCSGLVVAPGFIDAHSHSDLQVLEPRMEKVQQGVTTELVGNCGFSPYPASDSPQQLRDFANGIFCGGESWGWPRATDYLAETRRSSLGFFFALFWTAFRLGIRNTPGGVLFGSRGVSSRAWKPSHLEKRTAAGPA